jgi:hypothetical protein
MHPPSRPSLYRGCSLDVIPTRTRIRDDRSRARLVAFDVTPDLGRRRKRRHRGTVVVAAGSAFAALVLLLYAASIHAVVGNSDGATVVLEGQSMRAGNLLLHHWSLSLDSFWSVDSIWYALTALVTGVRPFVLFFVPALIAALVVVTGALIARTGYRGASAIAAATTVFALLALPGHVLAVFFLQGPLHVGTALWCLLAFACLRHEHLGWRWVAAVVLLAAGTLGDFQTVALGLIPAFVAGLVAMVRARDWHRGITTAGAPVVAFFLAIAVRAVINALGTFGVASANPVAKPSQILVNIHLLVTWGAHMLGVGGGDLGTGEVPGVLGAIHAIGLVVVTVGVIVAAVRLVRGVGPNSRIPDDESEGWRIDDLLVVACFADLVVFLLLTTSRDQDFSRYLTAAVIFGSILAGRVVGRVVEGVTSPSVRRGLAALGVGVVALFGAGVGFSLTAATPARPYEQLGAFLISHHLRDGVGDYWSASITTVATRDSAAVRPVIADPSGHIEPYERQSAGAWYSGKVFQFLVYDTGHPWGGINARSASANFGTVLHTYAVGTYRVLVWAHPQLVRVGG